MTIISTPTAATPEKQKQFDDLMVFLAERGSAQAQGKGPGKAMTPEQEALMTEMLASHKEADTRSLEEFTEDEEVAFTLLNQVLQEAFKLDGLRGVLQTCEDAVTAAQTVAEDSDEKGLELPAIKKAIAHMMSTEFCRQKMDQMLILRPKEA